MGLRLFSRKRQADAAGSFMAGAFKDYKPAAPIPRFDDALEQALRWGRFGFILSHSAEWCSHPKLMAICSGAQQAIDDQYALVPEGFACIPETIDDQPGGAGQSYAINSFLLGRHAVTNAEYQAFVDANGYEDLQLWSEDIWPNLLDFVDVDGHPGPRFLRGGRHDQRLARHPVVGVCHYEALAFSRWIGARLPAECEWQMAATWQLRSAAATGRRFPWGDTLDPNQCNIWVSKNGHTLPVDACVSGAAPNGVLQLIGNVWEWTSSDFVSTDMNGHPVVGQMLLKSIRGGAYDTFFPSQATGGFRSGLNCLSRTENVGFRCAMDLAVVQDPTVSA